MPTPLEDEILGDFEERLTVSASIPDELVETLMAHVRGGRVPAAEDLLETIRANVGDQSV